MIGEKSNYHRGPIKEAEYFYGRARETALTLQMVKNGQSVSVIGPRRIGKKSLLFHLSDPTVRARSGLVPGQSLFVYVDGSVLGGLSRPDTLCVMLQEVTAQAHPAQIDMPEVLDYCSFEQALCGLVKPG